MIYSGSEDYGLC